LNRNFDAEGVTILNLQGGGGFAAHYELFGPPGLKMDVLGLCDEDKEQTWIDALQNAGVPVADRAFLNAKGFYVCMKDLEDELISSLGIPAVQAIISAQGAGPAFAAFAQQPKKKTLSATDQLRGFIHGDNIRWVIHLIDALDLAKLPGALNALMSKV